MLRIWNWLRCRSHETPTRGLFPEVHYERTNYVRAVTVLAAKLAKCDGPVRRSEIDCFKRLFPLNPHERGTVAPLFDLARESPDGFQPFAIQLARMLANDPCAIQEIFERLYRVALADGALAASEYAFLEAVAGAMGAEECWRAIQARSAQEGDPYAVLGVTHDVSDQVLRLAWHRLIRRYHPDAMAARGEVELDHSRVATINDAYRRIVQSRRRRAGARA